LNKLDKAILQPKVTFMPPSFKLSNFDFDLPKELIAQKPVKIRDQSRLMILDRKSGTIDHAVFSDLPHHLPAPSLMIFNDTKVIPAKLQGHLVSSGREVEILLLRENDDGHWEALVKGLGKLKEGAEIGFGGEPLKATLTARQNDRAILKLTCPGDLRQVLDRVATTPLPPYINRDAAAEKNLTELDRKRYQTVFAKHAGSIAAPTAGLHFTPKLMGSLDREGINYAFLTLHVGVGTFKPIRSEDIRDHNMEAEQFHVPAEALRELIRARKTGQNIIAVGSTSTRVLESMNLDIVTEGGFSGWTDRFIYPGHEFKAVDRLLTNFHLPKSTLYLLVCAFAGKDLIEKAYREAIGHNYRFFSYGDALLIL
jgi:S-adenosylmethionine:tRNA ribosyltransferase-isomerase|tara:strand:+ start:47 stop:1150 length:1104 start_codon:yes stop_codon:yes gene_type:complete